MGISKRWEIIQNVQRVGLEIHTGMYPCLYVKCNDSCYSGSPKFSFIFVQHYFSVTTDRQKDGWGECNEFSQGLEIVLKMTTFKMSLFIIWSI